MTSFDTAARIEELDIEYLTYRGLADTARAERDRLIGRLLAEHPDQAAEIADRLGLTTPTVRRIAHTEAIKGRP